MEKQGEQQQQQQQGVVEVQPQPVAPADPAPPQQCPRCYSRNTKFCYFNNYSASQPRHLCKTCRRYWTQGGTLRNVPIGGGSRKGKRAKTSSSSSSTSSDNSQSLQKLVAENHLTPTVAFYQGGGSGSGVAVGGASAGGYLASLSTLNQLNNPSMNYHFDPSLINLGGVGGAGGSGSSSNLGLFQGFNAAAFLGSSSSSASQHQNIPQQQFYQLGNGELLSLYNSEQGLNLVNNVPSTMANNNYTTSAASMLQTQSFMNGAATATSNSNGIRALSDASLWSNVSTTNYISGANNTASAFGASTSGASSDGVGAGARAGFSNSLAPNQWFDLQRFQPPPQ